MLSDLYYNFKLHIHTGTVFAHLVSALEYFPHIYVLWPLTLCTFGFSNPKKNMQFPRKLSIWGNAVVKNKIYIFSLFANRFGTNSPTNPFSESNCSKISPFCDKYPFCYWVIHSNQYPRPIFDGTSLNFCK